VATNLPDTSYAVLGLIDKVPGSSGYELVTVAGRSLAQFWPISQTLLYRELARLTERGWVTATRVDQDTAPVKWTYRLTAGGRRALADWLATSAPPASSFRSGFLLRFFFAHRMRPRRVQTLLADYRRALQAQRDDLLAIIDKLSTSTAPAARFGRLAALHGLRTATARLAWVDEAEDELNRERPR
jgi:DNA-binding PadR family transcriptional regulator